VRQDRAFSFFASTPKWFPVEWVCIATLRAERAAAPHYLLAL